MERTLSIIKPDATTRNITGKVNAMIEEAGLRIVAQKRVWLSKIQAEEFYAEHKDKDQARHDIHDILGDRNKHRETGILHSDKPTRKAIQPQHSRGAPNTNIEI